MNATATTVSKAANGERCFVFLIIFIFLIVFIVIHYLVPWPGRGSTALTIGGLRGVVMEEILSPEKVLLVIILWPVVDAH
jgi:hypothetical protein